MSDGRAGDLDKKKKEGIQDGLWRDHYAGRGPVADLSAGAGRYGVHSAGGKYHLVHLSQELPLQFSAVPHAKTTVKARVALESTGESVVPWTECTVLDSENWTITFPRVPAGGLYRIETYMDYEGWDGLSCTRGDMVQQCGRGRCVRHRGAEQCGGPRKTR